MPITILIAGRNALANDVLCRAFSQRPRQFRVLGFARTIKDLIKQVGEQQPDVALVSVNLGGNSAGGIEALRELSQTRSASRAIMLLDCSDSEQVVEAFAHGARGVFCKNEDFSQLCKCVRSVYAGQVWADSSQLGWVVNALENRGKVQIVSAKGAPLLTNREAEIVRMLAEGVPTGEICAALDLSSHTIKNHLFNIYNKLGISSRAELVLYALGSRNGGCGGGGPSKDSAN